MTFLQELFGWFVRLFYDFTGSYGWAIVVFSIFSQLIMLPLTIKQNKSMQIMKLLGPEQQKLQKKYANNKEKLNEELMRLYKKNNYSPMSGCLPLLIQFPIIIGLFGVMREPVPYVFNAEEFATVSQSFLWINDLAKTPIDVFKEFGISTPAILASILPLLSVILTFLQQRQTLAGQDSSQKMMMNFMTIFIGYIGFTFSQGICIYWTLRTALTILQQYVYKKLTKSPVIIVEPEKKGHTNSKSTATKPMNKPVKKPAPKTTTKTDTQESKPANSKEDSTSSSDKKSSDGEK